VNFVRTIGRFFLVFMGATGWLSLFTVNPLSHCVRPPFYPRIILRLMI
jgi:phospholipid/cholesterol/gamma-HCH transport system permease protein